MFAPLLTEWDPVESAEGGIDPLGLYAIANSLSLRLVPGVRERMWRPRFLTAVAVSAVICSSFEEDHSYNDQSIDPYLMFEMYLVEGLIRSCWGENIQNLPGSLKAVRAVREGLHLSLPRYLVIPSVYGFHGVYRALSENLDVAKDGRLGEVGYQLLNAWMDERSLQGFYGTVDGPGYAVRQQLTEAVRVGIEKGATVRSDGWEGWEFFKDHLHPERTGTKEAEVITNALVNSDEGFRGEVLRFLISPKGTSVWESSELERKFHSSLYASASPGLLELLEAISLYERFARLMTDAFQDCLYAMSAKVEKYSPKEFAKLNCVQLAAKEIPEIFNEVSMRLSPYNEAIRFESHFSSLAERTNPADWVQFLLAHHRKIQKQKPPNGKNPWFETFDDGSVVIRPMYRTDINGSADQSYVHAYRTKSLYSFSSDLHLIQS